MLSRHYVLPDLSGLDMNPDLYMQELDRAILALHELEVRIDRDYGFLNKAGDKEGRFKAASSGFVRQKISEVAFGQIAKAAYKNLKLEMARRKTGFYHAVLDRSEFVPLATDAEDPVEIRIFVENQFGVYRNDYNPGTREVEPVGGLSLKKEFLEDPGLLDQLRKHAKENGFVAYLVRIPSKAPSLVLAEYAADRIVMMRQVLRPQRTHPLPEPSSF